MAPTPFQIAVPDSEVTDLKRRSRDTRWPASVLGAGWSMGVDLGYLRALADFWSESFDWRAIEARLNTYPHFIADTSRIFRANFPFRREFMSSVVTA